MKKEGRINVRYRVEMNILRAPSRLKAVWVTVITQTRMNGSKLINWIFNGVQQQFGLNEHFPMVPNSSLGMNLGSICTIQVLSIVRTGMYGVCLVWWRDRHLKPRVFKLEPLENILAIHKIIGNERKVKTIMLEHVLIWLPESIQIQWLRRFVAYSGVWFKISHHCPSDQCANSLVPDCWCTGEATREIWVLPYGTCSPYYSTFRTPNKEAPRHIPHPPDSEHEWRSSRHSPTTLKW